MNKSELIAALEELRAGPDYDTSPYYLMGWQDACDRMLEIVEEYDDEA